MFPIFSSQRMFQLVLFDLFKAVTSLIFFYFARFHWRSTNILSKGASRRDGSVIWSNNENNDSPEVSKARYRHRCSYIHRWILLPRIRGALGHDSLKREQWSNPRGNYVKLSQAIRHNMNRSVLFLELLSSNLIALSINSSSIYSVVQLHFNNSYRLNNATVKKLSMGEFTLFLKWGAVYAIFESNPFWIVNGA